MIRLLIAFVGACSLSNCVAWLYIFTVQEAVAVKDFSGRRCLSICHWSSYFPAPSSPTRSKKWPEPTGRVNHTGLPWHATTVCSCQCVYPRCPDHAVLTKVAILALIFVERSVRVQTILPAEKKKSARMVVGGKFNSPLKRKIRSLGLNTNMMNMHPKGGGVWRATSKVD